MLLFPKWGNGVASPLLLGSFNVNASVLLELYPELWISIGAIGPKVGFLYSLVITDPTLLLKLSTGHTYPLEDRFRVRLQDEYFPALSFFKVISTTSRTIACPLLDNTIDPLNSYHQLCFSNRVFIASTKASIVTYLK